MKKRIFTCAMILICFAVVVQGTVAFYTTDDTARNTITTSAVDVTLIEEQKVDGKLEPFPSGLVYAKPGMTISKIVSIKCEDADSWVRVKVDSNFSDKEGNLLNVDKNTIESSVIFDTNTEDWEYKDGWWYYKEPLKKGKTTENLFENVTFSKNMGNVFQGSTVDIKVSVQAVQVANNGNSVLEASGWE